jgi:hypothetical protein
VSLRRNSQPSPTESLSLLTHASREQLARCCSWSLPPVYRHLSPDLLLGGLAALMFAIDGGHAGGIGWIATHNTLLSVPFVLLALFARLRSAAVGCKR